MKAKVLNKKQLNYKVFQYDFEMIEPSEISILPGQFARVLVAPETYRSYSVYTDYKNTKGFSLAISAGHDGIGAKFFRELNTGDIMEFKGIFGIKLLPKNLENNIVFVATGTGITHIISFLYQLEDMKFEGNLDLYWGLSEEKDIYLTEELERFKKSLNFNYHMQYSTIQGRVDKLLNTPEFKDKNTTYYLCGHKEMVGTMNSGLLENGISAEKIFF